MRSLAWITLLMLPLLTMCTSAPNLPAAISPQEAQRLLDGQTNTLIAQATQSLLATEERRITEQALNDQGTSTLLPIAVQSTQQALSLLSDQATADADLAAAQSSIELTRTIETNRNQAFTASALSAIQILGSIALIICLCLATLRIGYAFASRTQPETFHLIQADKTLITYRQFDIQRQQWEVRSLLLAPGEELGLTSRVHLNLMRQWLESFRRLARAASIYGTWSIEVLSNRSKAQGVASEGAVVDLQAIGGQLGLLHNYKGTTGWDWADGADYTTMSQLLDTPTTPSFTLPLRTNGDPKPAPTIEDPKPSQEELAKQATPIQTVIPAPVSRKKATR